MKILFRSILFLASIGAPVASHAQPSVVGTWELTFVAPQDIENTMPGGVTNTKMHFTEDGRLFVLRPDSISLQDAKPTGYTFDGNTLNISLPGGQVRLMKVSFPNQETMVFTQQFENQRTFKRLASYDQKLEPQSLQLVADKSGNGLSVTYDFKDYSGLALVLQPINNATCIMLFHIHPMTRSWLCDRLNYISLTRIVS